MDEESFGFKEARTLLLGLRPSERKSLLERIEKKDPSLGELLRKNLYQFEDLKFLSPKMLIELLREGSLEDLGLALKGASEELKDFILSNVSRNMKSELEGILFEKLVPISLVDEKIEKIMGVVLRKVEKGELVLDKGASETIID